MKTCLTIAGSDSIGGAGIQADIKTMTALGVYGMTAIASLTAQNTTGVKNIIEVSKEFLSDQLEMIINDIFPDAVKTGCISSPELIKELSHCFSCGHTRPHTAGRALVCLSTLAAAK